MSIIEKPGDRIKELITQVEQSPGNPTQKKTVIDALRYEQKQLSMTHSKNMLEFRFPLRLLVVPTPRGNAMILEPWFSPSVSPSQTFRISIDDVLTMSKPDLHVSEYYMSVVQRVMADITMRSKQLSKSEITVMKGGMSSASHNTRQEQEGEDHDDHHVAKTLSEINQSIHAKNMPSEGNNIPFVMIMNEKKTLH